MNNKIINKLVVATTGMTLSLGALAVEQANATTFHFSSYHPQKEASFDFSKDGINLKVTGSATDNSSRDVVRTFLGLGVQKSGTYGENPEIDGKPGFSKETLLLSFAKKVSITSATFSKVGLDDDFTLLVDGNKIVSADIPGGNSFLGLFDLDFGTFDFTHLAPLNQGSIFGFTVKDKYDDYFLKKVEVEAVREPASVLGLLTLGAMGAGSTLKRKK